MKKALAIDMGATSIRGIIGYIEDGKVKLETPEEISIENEKSIKVEAKENVEVKATSKMKLEAQETELTGGIIKCNGTATPSGSGAFCAIPVCPFTGAPQCGTQVSGT